MLWSNQGRQFTWYIIGIRREDGTTAYASFRRSRFIDFCIRQYFPRLSMLDGHALDSRLNRILYRTFEYLPLSPNLHNPPQLLLHLVCSTFVCRGSSFGNDWREGDQEIILATSFRLLRNFYKKTGKSSFNFRFFTLPPIATEPARG